MKIKKTKWKPWITHSCIAYIPTEEELKNIYNPFALKELNNEDQKSTE